MERRIMAILVVLVLLVNSNLAMAATTDAECVSQSTSDGEMSRRVAVSLGDAHSAAIIGNGDLYCWGNNACGQIGNGTTNGQLTPVKILEDVTSVSLGSEQSAAITKNGDLYCWGRNYYFGQTGSGTRDIRLTPVKILEDVASVSLGNYHSAAITKNGDLYCWGDNRYGQVGNGTTDDQLTPVKILEDVASVSSLGYAQSAAITKNGDLYCWGYNSHGAVGNGTTDDQLTPTKILEDVVSVSLGSDHSAAITKNGDLYCWGNNAWGRIGNGTTDDQLIPIKVLENVTSVSLGYSHSAAITENGDLYHWGNNCNHIISGTTDDQLTPVKTLEDVASVSLGYAHSVAVTENGDLYCWGYNGMGQVGNGTTDKQQTPVKILEDVASVSLGNYRNAAITKSGDLYCWGNNSLGEVGNGTTDRQLTPVKVLGNMLHTHTYEAGWKSSTATHWKECSCGEKRDETAHTEDAGTVTKEPTETETGIRTYKCSVCGYVTKTEEIEKHGEGFFEKGDESTSEVETPPEATEIPEDDRITSITINPAFNMKHKDGNEVELDLSKIKIKAKEIYDEAGLKRAEAALGETLKGNKHYNLLDLTLLYDGKDFSNGYDGLVKVIIPIPKGHRDKTFSCYRLTEKDGKMIKELMPGQQTEDSYIIYLEHFSEYALVAAEPEESHTHVYSTDWKSDATGHWKECACKDRAEESVHIQDAGTVTKEATETETGIKTYKCSVCGYVIKTEVIAKLQKGTTNKQSSTTTKVTKAQKYKNGIIISKKISFKLTGNSLTVTWNKLPDVDGYDIFAASCDDAFKRITISVKKNNSSAIIRKINGKKIDGKKTYKVKIKAYRLLSNGKKQYIGTSAVMHVTGSLNKTRTNVKKIRLKKKAFALKRGKTARIRATIIKMNRKKKLLSKTHGPKLSYVSSDKAIATVTASGKIKAKKSGKCTIYVRALNGVSKKIKITVK